MPFAVESAGPFDLPALYAAVRDGANAVGLLAAADLPAALSVILEIGGTIVAPPSGGGPGLSLGAIGANPEAMACCASPSRTTTMTSRASWSRDAPA